MWYHKKCQILEVKADGNLSCQCQVNDLSIKMNTANALLFKIRKYVCPTILKPIYCTVFESHLSYCSFYWDQNFKLFNRL